LGKLSSHHVTNGYYVIDCISLGGLSHKLGFHFHPSVEGRLAEFEFFGSSYPHGDASFEAFQRHLEMTFGQPTVTSRGTEGFPSYCWQLGDVEVIHVVQEHFGPAEYVRIRRAP
jgi:hypothetical protein